jgi:hypothetical protein
MRQIIVAARRNDPRAFGVQKYANRAGWNRPGEIAPTGVCATRYLRRTTPDVARLSPLARFLVDHVPACVAGHRISINTKDRVRCYDGLTIADNLRRWATKRHPDGTYRVNCYIFHAPADALAAAERIIAMYGDMMHEPYCVDDWLFPIIEKGEDDTDYWNRVAREMLAAGVTVVETGGQRFEVERGGGHHRA